MKKLERPTRFQWSILFSVAFHLLLWRALVWRSDVLREDEISSLEIDLTRPFRLTSDPRLARKAQNPGTGAPLAPAPLPVPPKPPEPASPAPKEWILPGPSTQTLEKPGPDESTPSPGGLGDGGSGEVDWIHLTELPKILNREDVALALRRFYPPQEQAAGREGHVFLDVHIDAAGKIVRLDIAESGGASFDAAAKKVLSVARFSPAKVGEKAVPVKIRQTIAFRLEDQ